MNTKKYALCIVTGLVSVLCQATMKKVTAGNEKIVAAYEHRAVPDLNSVVTSEKNKKELAAPLKKEIDKHTLCLEKQISSKEKQEKAAVAQTPAVKKVITRAVEISNQITKDMITYKKHWTGHYTPSKFILMINGQEIKEDAPTVITVTDGKLSASFDYEFKVFGKVQRAGGRKLEYQVPETIEKIVSTFSWDAPANLVLNKGTLVASKDVSY